MRHLNALRTEPNGDRQGIRCHDRPVTNSLLRSRVPRGLLAVAGLAIAFLFMSPLVVESANGRAPGPRVGFFVVGLSALTAVAALFLPGHGRWALVSRASSVLWWVGIAGIFLWPLLS